METSRSKMRLTLGLLLMAALLHSSQSSLKTFCLKSEADCDSSWSPIENIDAALVGYDLPTANPFASDFIEDPGLRKQIFNATVPSINNDGKSDGFRLESGISAREYLMCDGHFKTKIATSISGYKKIAMSSSLSGFGYDIGIEAEDVNDDGGHEGALPSLVTIAWENTNDVKKLATFFTFTRGAVAISEAQCITHKVDVSQFLTPSFHPSFVGVLKIMQQQDTVTKQVRAFKRFTRDYGTHYLSSAYLGAKLSALTHYTSFERLKLGWQKLLECSSKQAMNKFKLNPEEDEDEDDDKKNTTMKAECWSEGDGNHVSDKARSRLVSFGTKPGSDLDTWPDEEILPIPIKFELTPIVNLFTEANLDERYNVSSKAILEWFLPLYLKYCKILKYDCYPNRGCGYDDECALQETCIKERLTPKGYRCLVLSWADVPNWPQMKPPSIEPDDPENDSTSRADTIRSNFIDPEPANVTWFRSRDRDNTGALSFPELINDYHYNHWYNNRYRTAMDRLINEADLNNDRVVDMSEYLKLHEKHPWYSEQLAFLLVNTDNNGYLTKDELMEASKVSEDISALNFSQRQLENLVDGLIGIGDRNGDKRITFEEYVHMSHDVFVDNFAPRNIKRVLRQ